MQVILDSSFARPGSVPMWSGKKGEFRDWTSELAESGRVLEVVVPPLVVNPLSVSVQATGKKRPILDLRYVNKC